MRATSPSSNTSPTRLPYARSLYPIVRAILAPIIHFLMKPTPIGAHDINAEKQGFLIVANHQSDFDPFALNIPVKRQIHYFMSDANLRTPLAKILFGLMSVIPKSKGMHDTRALRIAHKTVQQGGIVGIFGEGQCVWDGQTVPLNYATAKLAKIFAVPLYTARIFGTYFCYPRWARVIHRGRAIIHYQRLLTAEQVRALPPEHIFAKLTDALSYSAYTEQFRHQIHCIEKRRAEYCETFIFVCPRCYAIASIHSHLNTVLCRQCGELAVINRHGFLYFHAHIENRRFLSFEQWNSWQCEWWRATIDSMLADAPGAPILCEEPVIISAGYRVQQLRPIATGKLSLTRDQLSLHTDDPHRHNFSVAVPAIQGVNVQHGELLEFYANGTLYQAKIARSPRNSYKWMITIHHLRYIISFSVNPRLRR